MCSVTSPSDLYQYADEIDLDQAHATLAKQGADAEDPRWHWASVTPRHYTECREYSIFGVEMLNTNRKPKGVVTGNYVSSSRVAELELLDCPPYDMTRLAQLCRELNVAHENGCLMSIAMLVRAIVDHVPPIFGQTTFFPKLRTTMLGPVLLRPQCSIWTPHFETSPTLICTRRFVRRKLSDGTPS